MAKFVYNKAKNIRISYKSFELNYKFLPKVFFKKDVDLCFKSKSTDKVVTALYKLRCIYRKNFQYIQELPKRFYDQYFKPQSYTSG